MRSYAAHAPAHLPHAARRGVLLPERFEAIEPGHGPAHRRGASAGRGGSGATRAGPARPHPDQWAPSHGRDSGDRRRGRGCEIEAWTDLHELRGERLSGIPVEELEQEFAHAFRGPIPLEKRFLGGETFGELFDRVLPAFERLLAEPDWDVVLAVLHGAVNRVLLSYALTAERVFLGHFEQAAGCINVLDVGDEWIVRAVNVAPLDLVHLATRLTQMEHYWHEFLPYRERMV
jgi:Histidine phosphatase superfamily (branch 1)